MALLSVQLKGKSGETSEEPSPVPYARGHSAAEWVTHSALLPHECTGIWDVDLWARAFPQKN